MRRYLKLHTVVETNPKVAGLPTDADRWHYILMLVAAKRASPEGQWLNADYFRAEVRPDTADRLALFLDAALLVQDDDGTIRVRQYDYWQASDRAIPADKRDADSTDRIRGQWRQNSANYRKRHKTSYDASSQVSNEVTYTRHMTEAAKAASSSDSSEGMIRCGDCKTPKPVDGFCLNPKCAPF